MQHLDEQMQRWATRLRDDLKIGPPQSNCLASTISSEVSTLAPAKLDEIRSQSPVSFSDRFDELIAFQAFMDFAHTVTDSPAIIRAQMITQNYVCFVYLGDAWFKQLGKCAASGSTTKKCVRFLTENPVRAFRNAIAHANWKYKSDHSALEFWAQKGADPNEPMQRFEVSQMISTSGSRSLVAPLMRVSWQSGMPPNQQLQQVGWVESARPTTANQPTCKRSGASRPPQVERTLQFRYS